VYRYWHGGIPYVVVAAVVGEDHWLVMFDLDGIMETAFVVDRPARYFDREPFEVLGSVDEVLGC
jgi:hypothetical protein